MIILQAKELTRIYKMGEQELIALDKVNLEIEEGEFVAITGASGSGKSTLMHLIGCLDVPTSGEYFIDNKNVAHLSKDELAHIRNQKIGFVFQRFHLLTDLTALNNVALPLLYAKRPEEEAIKKASDFLDSVELGRWKNHYPYQMSGGQRQRVAIARSLINNPSVILADEPTGNLDTKTGDTIMDMFEKLNAEGKTIILVTHESYIAERTKRIVELRDGKIISDKKIR